MRLRRRLKITGARRNKVRKIFLKIFNDRGSGIVESMLVLIVISILVVVVMDRYETLAEEARKIALKAELTNIRQAILLFQIKNSRYPSGLKELITAHYLAPYKDDIISSKYLEHYATDKNKNIVDPFDLPFAYDPANGRVWSIKQGFEGW